jgi:hypothetical protein
LLSAVQAGNYHNFNPASTMIARHFRDDNDHPGSLLARRRINW